MSPEAYYSARVGEVCRMLNRKEITLMQAQEEIDFAGIQTDTMGTSCSYGSSLLLRSYSGNLASVSDVVRGCATGTGGSVTSALNAGTRKTDN